VRAYRADESLAEIEVKNRIATGDCIEFVAPDSMSVETVETMYDLNGRPIAVAHPGHKPVLLATRQPVEPLTVLRICIESLKSDA
jgi:hypothetical protein